MMRELICCALVMVGMLSACQPRKTSRGLLVEPKSTNTNTPIPSATATATLPPPTATFTITPTFPTPTFTLTPYPRLDDEVGMQLSMELFSTNRGCEQLPCWWGTIPGESRWLDVKNFLSSFGWVHEKEVSSEWFFNEVRLPVPRGYFPSDFDIFCPSMVKKPWANIFFGNGSPADISIAGQSAQ